jgi:branched-chain amino acid transport system ATP-binding protein
VALLLETVDLTVRYGGVVAVDRLNLRVEEGSIVGLIGPNGAGKTSFIDALTGLTAAQGAVNFGGRDLAPLPAHRRAKAGLVRTWQSIELFEDLTVRENLQVAAESESRFDLIVDLVRPNSRRVLRASEAVDQALAVLDLSEQAARFPTELSQGDRKLVGVARALAARPRLVCMDEPAAGLNSDESQAFGRRLRGIVDQGTSILLVDHDMGLVFEVCDYLFVINFGQLLAHGPAAEIRNDPSVVEAYLGGGVEHSPAGGADVPASAGWAG